MAINKYKFAKDKTEVTLPIIIVTKTTVAVQDGESVTLFTIGDDFKGKVGDQLKITKDDKTVQLKVVKTKKTTVTKSDNSRSKANSRDVAAIRNAFA